MTLEEIKQKIKDDIEAQYDWSAVSDDEEAMDEVKENYMISYIRSELSEEDFIALLNEMGYVVEDMAPLREEREKCAKRKAYRKELQARKKAKREADRAAKKAQKEAK